jgi:hypothetical protein
MLFSDFWRLPSYHLRTEALRHSVRVQAYGLFEAAVLGLSGFRKHALEPGSMTPLELEVRSLVTHTLTGV